MKQRQAAVAFILVAVLLDVLSLGLFIPVFAKLVKQLVSGDEELAAWYVGLGGTLWALMQFFCSPLMGALSDRFGRRPVLLISTFGLGLDYILLALAPSIAWLIVGRIITGITSASFSTAQAYLADVTEPSNRAAAYGMFGAAFGLGFVLGPATGGILADIDLRLPFWVSAALTLLNAAYGFFVLPESLPPSKRNEFRLRNANPLGSLRFLWQKQGLLPMALILFTYQLAHQVFQNLFVLYTDHRFAWSGFTVGLALASVGVLNFVVQGALIRPAVKKFGERALVFVGLAGGIVGFMAYAFSDTGDLFFASTLIFAVMGFFNPALQGIMSRYFQTNEQGQLAGANSSIHGIASLIGPYLFTTVFAWSLSPGSSIPWQGTPFALAAFILSVGLMLAALYIPRSPETV